MANFAPRGGVHRDSGGQAAPQRGGVHRDSGGQAAPQRGGVHRDSGGQAAPQRGGGFDRPTNASERKRMLDISREGHFRYDLREVLARSSLPPEQLAAFAATIFSKGSRQSTVEAKDWVTQKLNENIITKAERDAINTLIDRYSKFR